MESGWNADKPLPGLTGEEYNGIVEDAVAEANRQADAEEGEGGGSTETRLSGSASGEPLKSGSGNTGSGIVDSDYSAFRPTQESINQAKVDEYIAALKAGEVLPPVYVVELSDGSRYILDGHHRYVASLQCGIPIDIVVTEAPGPIGLPNWSYVQWKDYISEEQFWG